MSAELVKRLRERTATGHGPTALENEAADRIEQLERDLRIYMDAAEGHMVERLRATDELAAEKALADRLAVALNAVWRFPMKSSDIEAYRKARGL